MKRLCICVVLCMCLCFSAAAETADALLKDQLSAAGGDTLYDSLPEDTRRFLQGLGIHTIEDITDDSDPRQWLESVGELLFAALFAPLQRGGLLLAIVLLCALVDGLRLMSGDEGSTAVFQTVSVLAAAVALLPPLESAIQSAADALESLEVFMLSFVPVYAGVLLTSGRGLTAAGYQGVVLLAAQVLSWCHEHLLLPLTTASFGLGIAGGLNRELRLETIATRLNKFCVWVLGLAATLFTGMLSLKSVVSAAADTMGKRVLKLSIANFIPVVGGALSETVNTVAGCLALTRTAMGVFGMVSAAALILPVALQLAGWSILLGLIAAVADVFSLETVSTLLKAASGTVKVLLALLSIQGLFLILTVTIVTVTGGSA